MARLTDEEFRAWCQRNGIEPQTAAYLQRIRSSSSSIDIYQITFRLFQITFPMYGSC